MSDPIKSADLCNRCAFEIENCIENCNDCIECTMYNHGIGNCKCADVKPNTPCPYFVEDENDG